MNATQKAYAVAKANLDAANKIAAARIAKHEYLFEAGTIEDTDKYIAICEQVETELKIVELAGILHNAETVMINWAIETVSKSEYYNDTYKQMTSDIMAHLHLYSIRTKVVALAFRLG